MATPRTRRPVVETTFIVEMERDRDRTRKNLQAANERAEQYRRHLEAVEGILEAIK